MRKNQYGFTLMELLTVIAILSILAAILFPVFASARRNARRTVSLSNMKQCGTALIMYCNDYEGLEDMPMRKAASAALGNQITCDPNDTYRAGCSEDFGAPLVGSYAYVNGADDIFSDAELRTNWISYLHGDTHDNPMLMYSIFYADPITAKHHGSSIISPGECFPQGVAACLLPNRILLLRLDGSVRIKKVHGIPDNALFAWGYLWGLTELDD